MTGQQRTVWLLVGAGAVLYLAARRQQQQTAAQIVATAQAQLAPLAKPIVTPA